MLKEYFLADKLHHAYLLEGEREDLLPNILEVFDHLGIKVNGNPDFYQLELDSFKIDEALELRKKSLEKSFADNDGSISGKKFFLIYANHFSRDAQGVLLKMFEEPKEDIHFFVLVPDVSHLSKALVSRFFLVSNDSNKENVDLQIAKEFLKMNLNERIDFLKNFLKEDEEEGVLNISAKSKANKLLNQIESILHQKIFLSENKNNQQYPKEIQLKSFNQIFKVRAYLRQTGSSVKNLMESLALILPVL